MMVKLGVQMMVKLGVQMMVKLVVKLWMELIRCSFLPDNLELRGAPLLV